MNAVIVIMHRVPHDNIVWGPINSDTGPWINDAQSIMMNGITNNVIITSFWPYEYAITCVVVDRIVNDAVIPKYEVVNGCPVFKMYTNGIVVYNVSDYLVIVVRATPEMETMFMKLLFEDWADQTAFPLL